MSFSASVDKATVRRVALARRAQIDAATRVDAGERLAAALLPLLMGARRVAAYVAMSDEPPTAILLAARSDVLLPVLLPGGDLDWRVGERRATSGVDAIGDCDLVLVPAVAVDRTGVRLGRGGGSYDRALSRAVGLTIALLYDDELVDRLPCEPHDRAVDAVATPRDGVVRLPVGEY